MTTPFCVSVSLSFSVARGTESVSPFEVVGAVVPVELASFDVGSEVVTLGPVDDVGDVGVVLPGGKTDGAVTFGAVGFSESTGVGAVLLGSAAVLASPPFEGEHASRSSGVNANRRSRPSGTPTQRHAHGDGKFETRLSAWVPGATLQLIMMLDALVHRLDHRVCHEERFRALPCLPFSAGNRVASRAVPLG